MKCRIFKKGEKFYAKCFERAFLRGRFTLAWQTLKDGAGQVLDFDTEMDAENALRDHAKKHANREELVKEFEI